MFKHTVCRYWTATRRWKVKQVGISMEKQQRFAECKKQNICPKAKIHVLAIRVRVTVSKVLFYKIYIIFIWIVSER